MELVLLAIIVIRIFNYDFIRPWLETREKGRFVGYIKDYYHEKYNLFLIDRKKNVWERNQYKLYDKYYYMVTAVRWTSKGWEWARIIVYDSQQTKDAPYKPEDDIPIIPENLTDKLLDEGRKNSRFDNATFGGEVDRVWRPLKGEEARMMIADFEKFLTLKYREAWPNLLHVHNPAWRVEF